MSQLSKKILGSRAVQRLGSYAVDRIGTRWLSTIDSRVAYYDPASDVGRVEYERPVIYLFWHEYLTALLFTRRKTGLAMIASRHRDAELLSGVAERMGYRLFRGSTGRGGADVMRQVMADRDLRGLAVTPDGPRGPRRQIAPGAVFLASRLQIPIVLIGCGMDRPYRSRRSWDQFAIPRPFSRVRLIMGPRLLLPASLDRGDLEQVRLSLERSLLNLTAAAEAWAGSGRPHERSTSFHPGPTRCNLPVR